jgi:general secretion pathway protein D
MGVRNLCLILCVFIVLMAGCASSGVTRPPQAEVTQPITRQSVPNTEAIAEEPPKRQQTVQELAMPEFRPVQQPKPLPPKEPLDTKRLVRSQSPTLINTEAMPLSDFIVYALGDVLKVTFFIDEHVKNMKNPVTLRMSEELSPDRVLDIVIGFLERYDLVVEERSGALYITKSRQQAQRPVDIRIGRDVPESPADIVQIVVLRHVRAAEISGFLNEIYKTNVNTKIYYKENALVLSGQASMIREVVNLINLFDVPYMQGRKFFMLSFTYWQADEFIKQLSSILTGLGFNITNVPKDAGIYFIPIKALNSVLILAPDEETMNYILQWHKRLDTPEAAGTEEKSFTYIPKYSKSTDLVESLKRLYGAVQQPTPVPAGATPQPAGAPRPQPTTAAFSVAGLKVAADDKRNIVLISASPTLYKTILSYLESLDVPPRQVLLEATIAELTLKDDLKYGLEWYLSSRMNLGKEHGNYNLSTLGKLGLDTAGGLAFQFVSDTRQIQAVINAFAKEDKINILSSPRLMVLDNQEASIQVGTDVPILTGETKTTTPDIGSTVVTQSVQYRSTGLILRVKPNINTEGLLTLDIAIESSEAQQNNKSKVDSPMVLTRNIRTTVVASARDTIVLGGIMSENLSDTETKVPLLGDMPLIGNLFKTTSKSKTKTELIIMIRPVVITNAQDGVKITEDLVRGFKWLR